MNVGLTLRNGSSWTLKADDGESWLRAFAEGQALAEWLEVEPEGRDGRTFVRGSEVAVVRALNPDAEPQVRTLVG